MVVGEQFRRSVCACPPTLTAGEEASLCHSPREQECVEGAPSIRIAAGVCTERMRVRHRARHESVSLERAACVSRSQIPCPRICTMTAPQTNRRTGGTKCRDHPASRQTKRAKKRRDQCTQAPKGSRRESVENTGIACQPCCMTKRRKGKQTAANSVSPESATNSEMSRPDEFSSRASAAQGSAFGLSAVSRGDRERPLASGAADLDDRTKGRPANPAPVPVRQSSSRLGRARDPRLIGLQRLKALSRELEKLHRQEHSLLRERDRLVAQLRSDGESWASLSSRTGLSRQALSKRTS